MKNKQELAFPFTPTQDRHSSTPGMTLRDYFAAKAMNGMCSHVDTWGMTVPQIAKRAYDLADEMLRVRELP